MKIKNHSIRRVVYGFTAFALAVAALVPGLSGHASAAQVTSRSITMSSSTISATSVSYNVVFNPGTSGTVGGIVVDFCDNDPIIGDTSCTVPTGFTVTGSPTFTANSGMGSGWTAASLNSGQVFELSNATPQTVSTATPVNFTITSVTNPSTVNHSFYARILTFDTSAHMTAQYTVTTTTRASTFTNMIDYGGIALSTGSVINITARVMETLAFCVYNASCGDDPSMVIGHGGVTKIIDTSVVDTNSANFSISTNAQSGAVVRLKGDTLKSGSNSIAAVGASAAALTPGTPNFGVRVSALGSMTATSPYNGGAGLYALDTNAVTGVTSTYGQSVASIAGPINNSVSTLTFAATAGNTTPAGIYTAAEQLIATGSF